MAEYREQFWAVELLDEWSAEREDESTLLRRTDGVGTLAVTLLCDKMPVNETQLRELASSTLEEGHSPEEVQIGAFAGLYFAYDEEGVAWREWYLPSGNCLFFISYDCPVGAGADEEAEVEKIVASLRHLT